MINPQFSSGLATVLQRYVGMKRALGRQFDSATHALQSLDRLLVKEAYPDLNAAAFDAWCKTQQHLASGVRRVRMLEVHAFCVYRRRTEPESRTASQATQIREARLRPIETDPRTLSRRARSSCTLQTGPLEIKCAEMKSYC